MTPTYTEIIKQIATQIGLRKKLLFLRTLAIVWPVLLAIIAGYISAKLYGQNVVYQTLTTFPYIIYSSAYIIFSILYMWIVGFVFEIEKRIWVDSFFDKRELTSKQSWDMAQKLIWPAIAFRFIIFMRYYILPLIILLAILISPIFTYRYLVANLNYFYTYMAIVVASLILFGIYNYYLRIKLRFSWFVFLDMYKGGRLETHLIFEKMAHLNLAAKGEGFKKALILTVGTDSIQTVTQHLVLIMTQTIGVVSSSIPGIGDAGKMVRDITQVYGQSLVRQVTSYAEIVSMYILYRVASKQVTGEEQYVNEYVYGK